MTYFFKYIKYIKYILIFLLFVLFIGIDRLLVIINNISFHKILSVYILVEAIIILYLLIELVIFILLIKYKIKISYYLPPFLFDYLKKLERISKYEPEEIRAFMDLFVRTIMYHLLAWLFIVISYFYL